MRLRVAIALALIVSAFTLTSYAQDSQPTQDPTIDAAVSTLIAQTETAAQVQRTQAAATGTIQAALERALTGTAQALQPTVTPTPTVFVFDAGSLNVASSTTLDLVAGPAKTGAYLAPNGEKFAYLSGSTLCLYDGAVEQNCVDLEAVRGLEPETIRWSPDSRYVVFTEDFFRFLVDSDIWVWDTTANTLTDVTDDGDNRVALSENTWKNIDTIPAWLPDGRILFLRYNRIDGIVLPPDIYVINPDASGLEKLGSLNSTDPFAIFAMDASADHIVYNYFPGGNSPFAGIWMSDLDGSHQVKIQQGSNDDGVAAVEFSPDGRYVLANYPQPHAVGETNPEASTARVIDVAQRKLILIDPDQFVFGAGWSPQGSALVYATSQLDDPTNDGLYVTNKPGEAGHLLMQGSYYVATPTQRLNFGWGLNNTVLVASKDSDYKVVLVNLE